MRIRLLSDLHFEFHRDGGYSFLQDQNQDFDVLVIAGDLNTAKNLKNSFDLLKSLFQNKKIIFVPGNHEYYRSSFPEVQAILADEKDIVVLDNNSIVLDGVKFVGTTLWFPHSGGYERGDESLNDFSQISNFRAWVGKRAAASAEFLNKEVDKDCVVITHHLPHRSAIHINYQNSFLNKYFLHNVSPIVEDRGAKLWLFGHTHSSCDMMINNTRLVCNPFGYVGYATNSEFNPNLTINHENPTKD